MGFMMLPPLPRVGVVWGVAVLALGGLLEATIVLTPPDEDGIPLALPVLAP